MGRPARQSGPLTGLLAGLLAITLVLTGCSGEHERAEPGHDAHGTASAGPPTASAAGPVFTQAFTGPDARAADVAITVGGEQERAQLRAANIGVSFEATDLADPRWEPEAGNLDEVLAQLGTPALRFGGNKLDRELFWTSRGERAPAGKLAVTPADLTRVSTTVRRLGSSVTLGIPLGDFDPARGADMAAHAKRIFGDSLAAVSIGNEPNGYTADGRAGLQVRAPGSWNEDAYVTQVRDYVAAIRKSLGEDIPLVGPGAFDGAWMDAFLAADLPDTVALSQHWYATFDCASSAVPGRGPQWQNLVSPLVHDEAKRLLSIGLDKAERAGVPLWVEETGPTSCHGTNATSRTHASALWTTDYILHAAQLGVQRMGMHAMLGACRGGAPMSPVCSAQGDGDTGAGELRTQPNFTAMRLAQYSVGGAFHRADSDRADVFPYAVEKDGRLLVTIVNTADAAETNRRKATVTVPAGFSATRAAQVYGPENAAVGKTGLRGFGRLNATGASGESGVVSSEDGELVIDLASSTATTIEFARH